MALDAAIEWEVRTTGSDNNGGGFKSGASGTDFSQQDAAQLSLTDLATSGIGVTTLTSATGGFSSTSVGNVIQIRSGTNVTAGFYEITVFTDTNTVTIDRAPDDGVGGISAGVGDMGGGLITIDTGTGAVVAGNIVWVKNGTYNEQVTTLGAAGTSTNPVIVEGYQTTHGDNPTGTNRPLIDGQSIRSSCIDVDQANWIWKYLRCANATADGIAFGGGGANNAFICLKSSGNGDDGAGHNDNNIYIGCELSGNTGAGWQDTGQGLKIAHCYVHDNGSHGVNARPGGSDFTVFDTNGGDGIASSSFGWSSSGCVFYNNTDGLDASGGSNSSSPRLIVNNVFKDNSSVGLRISGAKGMSIIDFNCYHNNTGGDISGASKGDNAVSSDPSFTDAANGDFTYGSGSPCIAAGADVSSLDTGITGDYKNNIGVDQDDVAAAGGGTTGWWAGE